VYYSSRAVFFRTRRQEEEEEKGEGVGEEEAIASG
jgi:hypothetical protein